MLTAFKELLPRLFNYKRGNRFVVIRLEDGAVRQYAKAIKQQDNGWDCGPIVVSNISDYLKNPLRENKDFAQQQTPLYTIGACNELNHDDKVVRPPDC